MSSHEWAEFRKQVKGVVARIEASWSRREVARLHRQMDAELRRVRAEREAVPPDPAAEPLRHLRDVKRRALEDFERAYFTSLWIASDGNVSEVARRAGIHRAHARAYLRRYGLLAPRVQVEPAPAAPELAGDPAPPADQGAPS